MANQKVTALTALAAFASGDTIYIVDVSDTTDGAGGSGKKGTLATLGTFLQSLVQTLTNKTIDADNNTISNLAHGAEVDHPSSGVHGVTGTVVGTTDVQTLTNKVISAASNTYRAASTTVVGAAEIATAAETTTGTDATRAVSPDGLAGSDYGKRVVGLLVVAPGTNVAIGDGQVFFRVPSSMNGWNLIAVAAQAFTAGTTGTMDVQVRNVTDTVDVLSTKITIDSTEKDSSTAATPAVIDTTKDDVATADQIAIDVDAVQTTPAQGLYVELIFQLP